MHVRGRRQDERVVRPVRNMVAGRHALARQATAAPATDLSDLAGRDRREQAPRLPSFATSSCVASPSVAVISTTLGSLRPAELFYERRADARSDHNGFGFAPR